MKKIKASYWAMVAPAFVCSECGAVFETPVEWVEDYGQRFVGSPCCYADFCPYDDYDDEEGETAGAAGEGVAGGRAAKAGLAR